MKQHYVLEGTEYNRISKPSGQSWHKEKSNRTGAHVLKCAAQRQLSLNFSVWPYKCMACTHFLWRSLQVTWAKRLIWNKQPYFSALSLAALLPQPAGQIWLAGPKSSNSRCLAHRARSGQPPPSRSAAVTGAEGSGVPWHTCCIFSAGEALLSSWF